MSSSGHPASPRTGDDCYVLSVTSMISLAVKLHDPLQTELSSAERTSCKGVCTAEHLVLAAWWIRSTVMPLVDSGRSHEAPLQSHS
ncbi:hypothetical protein KCU90_g53, partial [Aureobasidium melanogenum]